MNYNDTLSSHNARLRDILNGIEAISSTQETPTQEKSIDITKNDTYDVLPDEGHTLSKVTANVNIPATPTQEKNVDIDWNGNYEVTADEGYNLSKVTANVNIPTQEKTVEITENGTTEIEADEGYLLSKATVNVNVPIPEGYIQPSGVLDVEENGTYDVTEKASVNVNVASSGGGENKLVQIIERTATEITAADLEGVTQIGNYAFYKYTALKSLTLPEGLISIGIYGIGGCTSLPSVTLPEGLISIGNDAFYGCTGLTSINIPNSVTSIGSTAFGTIVNLANITIGSGVTSIGSQAFFNCRATRIKVLATTPPTIQSNTFQSVPTTCIYEVPAASVETYKAATNWSTLNIVASEEF